MENATIRITVDSGLCNGCSMCAVVCPQSCITLHETPGGLLEAEIDEKSCTKCGICRKVCGGIALKREAAPNVDELDPFKGHALHAFLTKAKNPELRKNGQSGGAAIAIASMLLESNSVNGVLSTEMPKDGSFRPVAKIVRKKEDLFATQGSKYVPVPWADALRELNPEQDRIAAIGIPCQFRSLANALHTVRKKWEKSISLKIGLVCEGVLSSCVFDYIFTFSSICRDECKDYRFKSKIPNGWPGDGRAILFNGKSVHVPNRIRTGCKDAFRPLYCQLCFDKMNILSDIVCADPWGINNDKEGHSVVLVRTPEGLRAFDQAVESGVLDVEEIALDRLFAAQHVEARRTLWTAATRIVEKQKKVLPEYQIEPEWFAKQIGSGTTQLQKMMLERGLVIRTTEDRNKVVDSVISFNEQLKTLKKRIAFWNKWSPVAIVKRIWRKIFWG